MTVLTDPKCCEVLSVSLSLWCRRWVHRSGEAFFGWWGQRLWILEIHFKKTRPCRFLKQNSTCSPVAQNFQIQFWGTHQWSPNLWFFFHRGQESMVGGRPSPLPKLGEKSLAARLLTCHKLECFPRYTDIIYIYIHRGQIRSCCLKRKKGKNGRTCSCGLNGVNTLYLMQDIYLPGTLSYFGHHCVDR